MHSECDYSPERDKSYILVDTYSGYAFKYIKRYLFSLVLKADQLFANKKPIIIPLFKFEETLEIPKLILEEYFLKERKEQIRMIGTPKDEAKKGRIFCIVGLVSLVFVLGLSAYFPWALFTSENEQFTRQILEADLGEQDSDLGDDSLKPLNNVKRKSLEMEEYGYIYIYIYIAYKKDI